MTDTEAMQALSAIQSMTGWKIAAITRADVAARWGNPETDEVPTLTDEQWSAVTETKVWQRLALISVDVWADVDDAIMDAQDNLADALPAGNGA